MLNAGRTRKRVVLMQPYLLPYLGYYQLLGAAELFVSYDTAQFIKNGWIERNRYLLDGEPRWFNVALEKSSHTLPILHKRISKGFDVRDLINKLAHAYRKAPNASFVLSWLQPLLEEPAASIAELNIRVLKASCALIGVTTPIITASELENEAGLSGQARVLALMKAVGASHYLNPSAGAFLYDAGAFSAAGMQLQLLQARLPSYRQGSQDFKPGLSILDALMFNPAHTVGEWARQGVITDA
ncbi:WbqC family protein [Pseudomonas sp. S75]|uniref:WbqC family protein n=1 Tax=unclassified Pseudomonas TaxID=196821 RepID=UPI00190863C1|nr:MULTISPECIES: WbqC family protein [unclassified Pseudomonas]MBJ9975446.1 WbqC family protein [Pseudomonas sp. S30]MBK0152580.1 WbqC family protein [Pseudomonas sp. S75]